MKNTVIYIHGKGGNPEEARYYAPFFPDCEVVGFDYKSVTPWEARSEFRKYLVGFPGKVKIVAGSIGAYFAMMSADSKKVESAYFISPIADMERLIRNMMLWAGVTEEELREKGVIEVSFGDPLSWEYLTYAKEHPVTWDVPTRVLYGENDNLQSFDTIRAFSEKSGAVLTVMPGGEHWFHTPEQLAFLDSWLKNAVNN